LQEGPYKAKKEAGYMDKKMGRREFLKTSAAAGVIIAAGTVLPVAAHAAQEKEVRSVQLPKPQTGGGNSVLKLLEKRVSSREFGPGELPAAVLSNLLWAAFGITRGDGRRTAPSARNRQEIDIYVTTPDGTFLYDAKANMLQRVGQEDIRALTGTQPYVKEAAINLVYVADMSKLGELGDEEKILYPAADTGFISENVYLFCAAEGLATVVRALIDKPLLAKAMKLRFDQKIILAQSVGYPKKKA
jgi:nitroreductase